MSIKSQNIYSPAPQMKRGAPIFLGHDAKSGNILYPCGNAVVIRNAANPLLADIYYEHTCQVTVAKYAPSGFYICSGDVQGNVRIWDTTQKEHPLKLELRVLSGAVSDLGWSADSQRIVVVGDGKERYGAVFMWDAGSSVGEISGHTKTLMSADIKSTRPFRLATGGEDLSVNWFEGPPFKFKKSLKDNSRMITCVRFSPNGERLATSSTDKKVVIYDGKTGDKMGEFEGHKGGVYGISWSPDSNQLLTASADKTAAIWNVSNPAAASKVTEFALGSATEHQQLGCLWFGQSILSVNLDGDITYLNKNGGAPERVLRGHNKAITAMAVDESGKYVFTGSYDARILRWDVATGEMVSVTGTGHTNQVEGMAISGGRLTTCAMDNTLRITQLSSLEYGPSVSLGNPATAVAAGRRNADLVVVTTISSVSVIRAGKLVSTLDVKYHPSCVSISPSEQEVAVGGKEDKSVHVYRIGGDALIEQKVLTEGIRQGVTCVAYSSNGKHLATADLSRNILVWDLASGKVVVDGWIFHTASVNSLSWHADGVHLASGGLDGSLYVWSTAAKDKRAYLKIAHPGGVNVVAWVNDTTLASAGQDCALKTWEVALP
eukprot:m51a1_g1663 putative wd40 repeat-containing protein (604) ;mRNA; f:376123-378700